MKTSFRKIGAYAIMLSSIDKSLSSIVLTLTPGKLEANLKRELNMKSFYNDRDCQRR